MTRPNPNDLPDGIWGTGYIRRTGDIPGARRYILVLEPADTEWVPVHADVLRNYVDTGNKLEEALAELGRLRDIVWNNGEPFIETEERGNYLEWCLYCEGETTDTFRHPQHDPDCPWVAEAIRRAKETHPAADN